MQEIIQRFRTNIGAVKELDALYTHLHHQLQLPNDLSDLLRAEMVYAVSALDRLVHEIVQAGMLETFKGTRAPTAKYEGFALTLSFLEKMKRAEFPEILFAREIYERHKSLSFQTPEKISDGLSFVWDEGHKWNKIAQRMSQNEEHVKRQLKTIIDRRNQIVHEADLNEAGLKFEIRHDDVIRTVSFIADLGEAIFGIVHG